MGVYSGIISRMRLLFPVSQKPRILLFFIAIPVGIIASALSGIGFVWNSSALLTAGSIIWLAWFALLFLIALPATDKLLQNQIRWLRTAALAIIVFFLAGGLAELVAVSAIGLEWFQTDRLDEKTSQLITSFDHVFGYNDATALCHQATENLIAGDNPYAQANVVSAMIEFDGPFDKLTPLREGRFAQVFPYPGTDEIEKLWQEASENPEQVPLELESNLGYPAGCFLLPAPFVLLGMDDLRLVYLIFILLALVYTVLAAPRNTRLLLIAALLISLELWNSVAGGETGSLIFPFLLLGWVLPRRHLWLSALFMGIAVATKQVAWFFMPFYLILIFRTMGLKRMLSALGIVSGVFIITNAPFIISNPMLWASSVLSSMTDNLFPLGVGIITLVTGGILGTQSSLIFSLLELCVLALAIIWYFRYCPRYPHTGPILAILPLFFAWRSLWPYFFYADIIVLAAIIINDYGTESLQPDAVLSPPEKL